MAKNKEKINDSVAKLLKEYVDICGGNPIKANSLKEKYTTHEMELFLYQVKSQVEALDTENLYDIEVIEQLAELHIQMNRVLKFQKDLLDKIEEFKTSEQPGDEEKIPGLKKDIATFSGKWIECNDKCKSLITTLNQERQQRAKQNLEQRVTLAKIINDLNDINNKERIGKHGAILKKSMERKKKEMIEQELILVAKQISNETQKEEVQTETQE